MMIWRACVGRVSDAKCQPSRFRDMGRTAEKTVIQCNINVNPSIRFVAGHDVLGGSFLVYTSIFVKEYAWVLK